MTIDDDDAVDSGSAQLHCDGKPDGAGADDHHPGAAHAGAGNGTGMACQSPPHCLVAMQSAPQLLQRQSADGCVNQLDGVHSGERMT